MQAYLVYSKLTTGEVSTLLVQKLNGAFFSQLKFFGTILDRSGNATNKNIILATKELGDHLFREFTNDKNIVFRPYEIMQNNLPKAYHSNDLHVPFPMIAAQGVEIAENQLAEKLTFFANLGLLGDPRGAWTIVFKPRSEKRGGAYTVTFNSAADVKSIALLKICLATCKWESTTGASSERIQCFWSHKVKNNREHFPETTEGTRDTRTVKRTHPKNNEELDKIKLDNPYADLLEEE